MPTRKVLFVKERVLSEAGSPAPRPVCRVAVIAVIDNPFAGRFAEDLSPLFDIGAALGEELMPSAVEMLEAPPTSYGKSAIVGVNGDVEHAAAVLHSKLGKPMRAAVGGGEAIIPSTTVVQKVLVPVMVPTRLSCPASLLTNEDMLESRSVRLVSGRPDLKPSLLDKRGQQVPGDGEI